LSLSPHSQFLLPIARDMAAAAGMAGAVAGMAGAVAGTVEAAGVAVAGTEAGAVVGAGDGDRASPSALPYHQPITIHRQPTTRRHIHTGTPRVTMVGLPNNTGTLRVTKVGSNTGTLRVTMAGLSNNPTMPAQPQLIPATVARLTSQRLALIESQRNVVVLCASFSGTQCQPR